MSAKTAGILFWLLVSAFAGMAIYWQLRHPPQLPITAQAAKRPPELPSVTPVQPFRLPLRQQYGDIINRPIFIPARRPEPPPPPEEEQVPKPLPAPEQKFMLLGVLIAPGLQAALLRPQEPNAKTVRVKRGELLGEWRLEAIFPNRVILRKDQSTQELLLMRLKKPGGVRGARAVARPPQTPGPVFGATPAAPESAPATSAPPAMPAPTVPPSQ